MPSERNFFSFCQISNLWLDTLSPDFVQLPPQLADIRSQELLSTLKNTLLEAAFRKVDAVFILGTLWDASTLRRQTLESVQDIFSQLDNLPIFIAPGLGEANSPNSFYDQQFLQMVDIKPWTPNVQVFDQAEITKINPARLPGVALFGHSLVHNRPIEQNTLSYLKPDRDAQLNIFLLNDPIKDLNDSGNTAISIKPNISQDSLAQLSFDYIALGFGDQSIELDDGQRITACGAGSLLAQKRSLTNRGQCLLGTMKRHGQENWELAMEELECDPRRIYSFSYDVTGLSAEDTLSEALTILQEEGAREQRDIVIGELEGRYPKKEELQTVIAQLAQHYFFALIEDNTHCDYISGTFASGSCEARFIEKMLDTKRTIEKSGENKDKKIFTPTVSGKAVEYALYYGLKALQSEKVNLHDKESYYVD